MGKQLDDYIKEELRKSEIKRKYCEEHFADYEDNEFNCAEMKFIYGVKSITDSTDDVPSFCTLNDFVIYYNRLNKTYYADIDAPLYLSAAEKVEYLNRIKNKLFEYIQINDYMMPVEELIENSTLIQLESTDLLKLCNYAYIILCGVEKIYGKDNM